MVLIKKWPLFQLFFLGNIGHENVFYDILDRKNDFLDYKDKKFQKSKNSLFLKGVNLSFWSKNGHFLNFFSLGNIGQENVFYDILERKNAFLGYKNKKFKKSKNGIFPKGLTHGFGRKMAIIPNFFFLAIQARKMSFTIFQNEKKRSQAIKTTSSKSQKIDLFPKGLTDAFGQKMAILPTFFFRQYRAVKRLLRYSRTKKHLSRLQK